MEFLSVRKCGNPECRLEYFQTLKTYPWLKSVIYMDKEICKLMMLYELVKRIFIAVMSVYFTKLVHV